MSEKIDSNNKSAEPEVKKTYTEEEFEAKLKRELDTKIELIKHELRIQNEAKLAVKQNEINEKINALNKEVYGAKAFKYFSDLNGDTKKFEDFIKANDIDITKSEIELKKTMEHVMEKKPFYRDNKRPITYIDSSDIKDGEREEDFLQDALRAYNETE